MQDLFANFVYSRIQTQLLGLVTRLHLGNTGGVTAQSLVGVRKDLISYRLHFFFKKVSK